MSNPVEMSRKEALSRLSMMRSITRAPYVAFRDAMASRDNNNAAADCACRASSGDDGEEDDELFDDASSDSETREVCLDVEGERVSSESARFDDRIAYVPAPSDVMPGARFVGASILPVAFDPKHGLPYVLLGRSYRQWSLIGGHCRAGERPEDGAAREFWEETMGCVAMDHMETLPLADSREIAQLLVSRNYLFHMISTDEKKQSYVVYVREVPFDGSVTQRFEGLRQIALRQHETYGSMVKQARQASRYRYGDDRRSWRRRRDSDDVSSASSCEERLELNLPPASEKLSHIITAEGKVPKKFLEMRSLAWFSLPMLTNEHARIRQEGGDIGKAKQRPWTLDMTCVNMIFRCVEELNLML